MDPELLSEERTELLEPLVRTFEEELLLEPLPLTRTFEEELLLPEERLDCPVEELERLVLLVLPVERRSSCWKEEDPELREDEEELLLPDERTEPLELLTDEREEELLLPDERTFEEELLPEERVEEPEDEDPEVVRVDCPLERELPPVERVWAAISGAMSMAKASNMEPAKVINRLIAQVFLGLMYKVVDTDNA